MHYNMSKKCVKSSVLLQNLIIIYPRLFLERSYNIQYISFALAEIHAYFLIIYSHMAPRVFNQSERAFYILLITYYVRKPMCHVLTYSFFLLKSDIGFFYDEPCKYILLNSTDLCKLQQSPLH